MRLSLFLRPFLGGPRPSTPRRRLLLEGLEDRTVPAHGLRHHAVALHGPAHHHRHHHPAVVMPAPVPVIVSNQGGEESEHEDDNDKNERTPSLTETVTANFTGTTTLQLDKAAFAVQNGQLVATGTLAGQAVTIPVTFTAASGTTAPTISLALRAQTITVAGQQVSLGASTLLLSGPNAPTTALGTAIGNDAANLNKLTDPAKIADELNGLLTTANSALAGTAVSGSVTAPLTINRLTAGSGGQILAGGTFLGQTFSNVPLQVTGTGSNTALTLGPLSVTVAGTTTTFSQITVPLKPLPGADTEHLAQRLDTLQVLLNNSSAAQARINALDRVFAALGATGSGEGEGED